MFNGIKGMMAQVVSKAQKIVRTELRKLQVEVTKMKNLVGDF